MKKALVPLADGFEDIEAVSIVDVLRRGGVNVVTASLSDGRTVRSAHGIQMEADARILDALGGEYDAIILPGGGEGTQNLSECEPLLERAEVIEDEAVTCYPSCASQMGRPVESVPVIADGQIITGQGPGAAMLFALVVLAHLTDEKTAHGVANGMITELS